jgi:hypothetical protein
MWVINGIHSNTSNSWASIQPTRSDQLYLILLKNVSSFETSPTEAKDFEDIYLCSPELNSITAYFSVFSFIIENVPADLERFELFYYTAGDTL